MYRSPGWSANKPLEPLVLLVLAGDRAIKVWLSVSHIIDLKLSKNPYDFHFGNYDSDSLAKTQGIRIELNPTDVQSLVRTC